MKAGSSSLTIGTGPRAAIERTAAACLGSRRPPVSARPSVVRIRPVRASSRQVRPEPDAPSTATSAPGAALNVTFRKTQPRGPLIPKLGGDRRAVRALHRPSPL
ncbi:hypothetical protein SCALM49S_02080 [Streptomyces californicus]